MHTDAPTPGPTPATTAVCIFCSFPDLIQTAQRFNFLFEFDKMASVKERVLISCIGDQDTVTGLLLSGIGHIDSKQRQNFLVVDSKTQLAKIEEAFTDLSKRRDIAIILINQHVADDIRELIDAHTAAFPTILEIPSKDHPYDPAKDSVFKRIQKLFGSE